MQKLSDNKITIIHKGGQHVSEPASSRKSSSFFGLFTSQKAGVRGNNPSVVLKESLPKKTFLSTPRANASAVKSWVGMEEKIVHDYKEQKKALSKNTSSLPKNPAKQSLPALEAFSTQTAVFSSSGVSKSRDLRQSSGMIRKFLRLAGWLVAGTLAFFFVQNAFLERSVDQKFSQLQSEKENLKRSYASLQTTLEEQREEIKWSQSQLQDTVAELKTVQDEKAAYKQSLEKKYREELMRITVRYESDLAVLRDTVQTQKAIVNALKTQNQNFEQILHQAGMSALSGVASGISKESFPGGASPVQGKVTSVNARQGFIVFGLGADQGARSGHWIEISRNGVGLATGRIDRVYPTMSVAIVRNEDLLQVIQEGDTVSLY